MHASMLDQEVEVVVPGDDEGVMAVAGGGGGYEAVDALVVVGDVAWVRSSTP